MTLDELWAHSPYDLTAADKEAALSGLLSERTRSHYANCEAYRKILDRLDFDPHVDHATCDLPFIPVRLFKTLELRSVPKEAIVKTLTSSGTSGQAVSRIFLDADNVRSQTKTLNAIISSFIGKGRLPLLLLDTEMIKKDRSMY